MNPTTLTSQHTESQSASSKPGPAGAGSPTPRTFTDLSRDRVADLVRVAALGVVIVWHSTLSLFHYSRDGVLSMPNPIGDYRGLWMLTWLLQVMPLFFVVSGAVNADAWTRHRRHGGTSRSFSSRRIRRFISPLVLLTAICGVIEITARLSTGEAFLPRYLVILVPLWTLALLVAYAPLTPMLDRAWRRYGASTTVGIMSAVVLSDLIRFRASVPAADIPEIVSTLGVWLLAYHLGWVYRDAVRAGADTARGTGRIMTMVGFVGLVVTTNIGLYPRSMVATTTDAMSNLLPTTAPIMFLAVFQCGLLLLARPRLAAWLARGRNQHHLDALGGYALPAYLFHMFAVVAMVLIASAIGVTFSAEPTATWWLTRPLWLCGVIVLMIPLLRGLELALTPRRRTRRTR